MNKPKHYTRYSFEVIDVIDEVCPNFDSSVSGHLQNVIKYVFRAPFKGTLLKDLRKAEYYLKHTIEILQAKIDEEKRVKFIDEIEELYRYQPSEDEIVEKVFDEY